MDLELGPSYQFVEQPARSNATDIYIPIGVASLRNHAFIQCGFVIFQNEASICTPSKSIAALIFDSQSHSKDGRVRYIYCPQLVAYERNSILEPRDSDRLEEGPAQIKNNLLSQVQTVLQLDALAIFVVESQKHPNCWNEQQQ